MFFFEPIAWYNILMWFVVFGLLIGLNEIARSSKLGSIALFMALPVVLTPIWFIYGDP